MEVPETTDDARPCKSLPHLLEKAQANAVRLGYAPNAFAKKLQEAKDDPEGAKKKAVDHAARMSVDVDAVVKKWANANTSPFPSVDQLPRYRMSGEETCTENREESQKENGMTLPEQEQVSPEINMQDLMSSAQNKVIAQPPSIAVSGKKRGLSRSKKETTKLNRAKKPKKSIAKSAPLATDVVAESSKNGARRDAEAAPELMDIDYTPSLFVSSAELYPVHLALPEWYTDIKKTHLEMKKYGKRRTPALTALDSLKNCVGRCEDQMKLAKPADEPELMQLLEELRDHVHKAEFLPEVDKYVVKTARILTEEYGLPRIFREDASFPVDLKADSYQLYSRWMREDFLQDILRGIDLVKGESRTSDRLDSAYKKKHPTSAKEYGANGLVIGQWWPTQLCTVRDGAHGSSQGGIFGANDQGAYSIVLSGGGGYHDRDDGEVIEYSGTDGKDGEITQATQHMITSARLGNDIRVIRSHHLPKLNKYRPEYGLRYDGLYQIKGFTVVDKAKQIHRFTLHRCPGQQSIRCEKNRAQRPTVFEVNEFLQSKVKLWS